MNIDEIDKITYGEITNLKDNIFMNKIYYDGGPFLLRIPLVNTGSKWKFRKFPAPPIHPSETEIYGCNYVNLEVIKHDLFNKFDEKNIFLVYYYLLL